MATFTFVLGMAIGLFGLMGLGIWIWTTVLYFFQARSGRLRAFSVTTQFPFAIVVTLCIFLALSFVGPAFVIDPALSHVWYSRPVLVSSMIVVGVVFVLWLLTGVLFLLPVLPRYIYLLPRDAKLVRWLDCQQGIVLAAKTYLTCYDPEILELIAIGTNVLFRDKNYPKKRRFEQLTNEFETYTKLTIEGFTLGYQSFWTACEHDPEHLEQSRKQMQEGWPNADATVHMVEELASGYLLRKTS